MKVILTGGAGFIGANAARRHLERGDGVVVIDDLSRRGAGANLDWLRTLGDVEHSRTDLRDAAALARVVADHRDAV
jgi:CDP-paratose 2-epimerase